MLSVCTPITHNGSSQHELLSACNCFRLWREVPWSIIQHEHLTLILNEDFYKGAMLSKCEKGTHPLYIILISCLNEQ